MARSAVLLADRSLYTHITTTMSLDHSLHTAIYELQINRHTAPRHITDVKITTWVWGMGIMVWDGYGDCGESHGHVGILLRFLNGCEIKEKRVIDAMQQK